MYRMSYRNRIASYYIVSTALFIFLVFSIIFLIVKVGVYRDLEHDIDAELADLSTEINITDEGFSVIDEELKEKEHNTLSINPIFIQFTNADGQLLDKSPNLRQSALQFGVKSVKKEFTNNFLDGAAVRQAQAPVYHQKKIVGYMLVAVPLIDANRVLDSLSRTLFIAYPLILLALFFIARIIAGRSIRPVASIIGTANIISRDNLNMRIELPVNRDELYILSKTINDLLNRIENAIEREKQFTSDASHELRTPLAVIKGTLEVLVRKQRDGKEYEEKINYCIQEVDRINTLVDQLLLLARFESQKQAINVKSTYLNAVLLDAISRQSATIQAKGIQISSNLKKEYYANTDEYLLSIIIENLIANAVKYSHPQGTIEIGIESHQESLQIFIADNGIGISAADMIKVFGPFYRSKPNEHPEIKGTGLGLSIVKRLCTLLDIQIDISSKENEGTTVKLTLPEISGIKS